MPPEPQEPVDAAEPATRHAEIAEALSRQGATIPAVHNGRGRPASDRFRVYRNNVTVSLREALAATFSTTRRLMGDEFFDAAAVAFAQQNRPASPMLYRYGSKFPAFLASLPGLSAYPFVPEVAALEFARVQANHAADTPPLAPDALGAVPPDALGGLVFTAHPATRIVPLPEGGFGAWAANQSPPETPAEAAAAIITRPQMHVFVTPLGADVAPLAKALLDGVALGEAAADQDVDLGAALARLLSVGAFCGLTLPSD